MTLAQVEISLCVVAMAATHASVQVTPNVHPEVAVPCLYAVAVPQLDRLATCAYLQDHQLVLAAVSPLVSVREAVQVEACACLQVLPLEVLVVVSV